MSQCLRKNQNREVGYPKCVENVGKGKIKKLRKNRVYKKSRTAKNFKCRAKKMQCKSRKKLHDILYARHLVRVRFTNKVRYFLCELICSSQTHLYTLTRAFQKIVYFIPRQIEIMGYSLNLFPVFCVYNVYCGYLIYSNKRPGRSFKSQQFMALI